MNIFQQLAAIEDAKTERIVLSKEKQKRCIKWIEEDDDFFVDCRGCGADAILDGASLSADNKHYKVRFECDSCGWRCISEAKNTI